MQYKIIHFIESAFQLCLSFACKIIFPVLPLKKSFLMINITIPLALMCCFNIGMNSQVFAQQDSAYGKVYFMRLPVREQESLLQMATNYCNVFIDSNFICRLDEKKYFIMSVPAGIHRFDMRVTGKKIKDKSESIFAVESEFTSFNVEVGKSYYIQFVFRRYDNRRKLDSYCKYLTEERANMMLPDLKEDKSCYKDVNQTKDDAAR